jgi:predicted DCC family thiol-disulfide oxidoreductase YuxK
MTKLLHNDTCPICSREVAAYARQAEHAGVALEIDGLDAAADWGLDRDAAARTFRVQQNGRIVEGLDAFRLLWARLPGWRWLARLTGLPGIHCLADRGYRHLAAPALFALHRRRERRAVQSSSR